VDPEWWPVSPARNIQRQAADEQRFTRLAETTGLRAHLEHRLREAAPPADETVAIRDALTRLPADDRELLTLVAWDGLRTDEAAALLGITSAAARQRLVRARRRLRAELDTAPDATTGNDGRRSFTPTGT
jgi:RNA polymerase sigma factor (sigma-70 family)